MQKLTKEQAIIISGYTGIMCCKFEYLHKDVEKRTGRPVWTHEFGSDSNLGNTVRDLYKDDFIKICSN